MTSLFEQVGTEHRLPAGLVSELMVRGSRKVSALNFLAVETDAVPALEGRDTPTTDPGVEAASDDRARRVAAMIEAAREDAAAEARREMQAQWELQQAGERARAERLTVEFARDRRRYFAAAETQVVKLALLIAERILAQPLRLDEAPLAATVRAALAQVQDDSSTALRVHPGQAELWRSVFAEESRITVTEDTRLAVDDCVLETTMGQIALGIPAQMAEVRRGFEDLMTRTGD